MARHKNLLNDLNTATQTIRAKDHQIELLMAEIRQLTEELKKYKEFKPHL
jgi:ABC-type transporter Mla subunit MlaD